MKKRFRSLTLGCKTNQYETQAIKEALASSGEFIEAEDGAPCDLYVINTCTVTSKADKDSRWTIRRCHKESPAAQIVITGCLAELDSSTVKDLPGVTHIIRNKEKHLIADILTTSHESRVMNYENPTSRTFTPLTISRFDGHTKAFIKIQDGCDNFCSYCKIPLVRGRSTSRPARAILDEVSRLVGADYKELVLTGICLGDWGRGLELTASLANLLREIVSIDGDFRVRLSSIEPKMVTPSLLDVMASSKKICPHLHIPLQSGSNHVLSLMNRPYTAKEFLMIIAAARMRIRRIAITSDVLVGFPGESDRDFKDTIRVVKRFAPSRLHIFPYSKRQGTRAAALKDTASPQKVKERRAILEKAAKSISFAYRKGFKGKRVEGLIETARDRETGLLTGYTENYIRFLMIGKDELKGRKQALKVTKVEQIATYCEQLT